MNTANTKVVTATKAVTPVQKQLEEKRLRDTDNTSLWTVIALKDCEWSKKAVELLTEHKEQVKVINLNTEWQRRLVVEFNCRRSPAIFRGATYIGSYDALENYYKCSFFTDHEVI
jgi:glutaredoxin